MSQYSKNQAFQEHASSHRNVYDTEEDASLPTDNLMSDMIFKLRVNQLVTTLSSQGLDTESKAMLNLLETLVIAGEIEFTDFMQRVQNLFPHVFDQIDAGLRENLLRMLKD
jgi:hypothetical protein